MARIVFEGDQSTVDQLDDVAKALDLPKVRTLKLAVSVLHKLSRELDEGADIVIKSKTGAEKDLWMPWHTVRPKQVERPDAE